MSNKSSLRQQYTTLRKNFTSAYQQTASQIVAEKILNHSIIKSSDNLCVYISLSLEIDTHHLIDQLLLTHKKVWSPVIQSDHLILRQLSSLTQCIPGQMGILEPSSEQPQIDPRLIDGFIVPGLAFDTFGFRLGYGKGYYDRLLTHTSGFRLGIAYTDQLAYRLPHDAHDIRMHQIITDTISFPTFPYKKK